MFIPFSCRREPNFLLPSLSYFILSSSSTSFPGSSSFLFQASSQGWGGGRKSGRSMINRGRRRWRPRLAAGDARFLAEEKGREEPVEFGSWFTRLQRFSLAQGNGYWWLGAATYVAAGWSQVRLGNSLVCATTIPFKWKLPLSWKFITGV